MMYKSVIATPKEIRSRMDQDRIRFLEDSMEQLGQCHSDSDFQALAAKVQSALVPSGSQEDLLTTIHKAESELTQSGQKVKASRMSKMGKLVAKLPSASLKKQRRYLREILKLCGKNAGVNIGKRSLCGSNSLLCNAACITGSVLTLAGATTAIVLAATGQLDTDVLGDETLTTDTLQETEAVVEVIEEAESNGATKTLEEKYFDRVGNDARYDDVISAVITSIGMYGSMDGIVDLDAAIQDPTEASDLVTAILDDGFIFSKGDNTGEVVLSYWEGKSDNTGYGPRSCAISKYIIYTNEHVDMSDRNEIVKIDGYQDMTEANIAEIQERGYFVNKSHSENLQKMLRSVAKDYIDQADKLMESMENNGLSIDVNKKGKIIGNLKKIPKQFSNYIRRAHELLTEFGGYDEKKGDLDELSRRYAQYIKTLVENSDNLTDATGDATGFAKLFGFFNHATDGGIGRFESKFDDTWSFDEYMGYVDKDSGVVDNFNIESIPEKSKGAVKGANEILDYLHVRNLHEDGSEETTERIEKFQRYIAKRVNKLEGILPEDENGEPVQGYRRTINRNINKITKRCLRFLQYLDENTNEEHEPLKGLAQRVITRTLSSYSKNANHMEILKEIVTTIHDIEDTGPVSDVFADLLGNSSNGIQEFIEWNKNLELPESFVIYTDDLDDPKQLVSTLKNNNIEVTHNQYVIKFLTTETHDARRILTGAGIDADEFRTIDWKYRLYTELRNGWCGSDSWSEDDITVVTGVLLETMHDSFWYNMYEPGYSY